MCPPPGGGSQVPYLPPLSRDSTSRAGRQEWAALTAPRDTKHFCAGARAMGTAGGGPGDTGAGTSGLAWAHEEQLRVGHSSGESSWCQHRGGRAPPGPGGDLLRGDRVGNGLLQQLQAVQDPVAEPGAAGVQTLRGQEAGSWARQNPKTHSSGAPRGERHDPRGPAPPLLLPQGQTTEGFGVGNTR